MAAPITIGRDTGRFFRLDADQFILSVGNRGGQTGFHRSEGWRHCSGDFVLSGAELDAPMSVVQTVWLNSKDADDETLSSLVNAALTIAGYTHSGGGPVGGPVVALVTPGVVAAVAAVPTPSIFAVFVVTPGMVTVVAGTPAPSITAAVNVTPDTVVTVLTVPQAAVSDLFIPKLQGPILGAMTDNEKSALDVYTGSRTFTTDTLLEGVKFDGRVTVKDGAVLTLNDCWHAGGDIYYTFRVYGNSLLVIEDSEIGNADNLTERGIAGPAIVSRCYIHSSEDGVKLGAGSRYTQVTIENLDSPGADPHADCIQAEGATTDAIIDYCYLSAYKPDGSPANAAIILKADLGVQDDITISNSLLAGGNYTAFVKRGNNYPAPTNVRFIDNIMDDRLNADAGAFGGYRYGILSNHADDLVWEGNTDLTTGNPVTVG